MKFSHLSPLVHPLTSESCEQRVEETFSAHGLVAVNLGVLWILCARTSWQNCSGSLGAGGELPTNQDGYKHTGLSEGRGRALPLLWQQRMRTGTSLSPDIFCSA